MLGNFFIAVTVVVTGTLIFTGKTLTEQRCGAALDASEYQSVMLTETDGKAKITSADKTLTLNAADFDFSKLLHFTPFAAFECAAESLSQFLEEIMK